MNKHNFELIDQVLELIQDGDYESAYKLIKPEAEKGNADFQHMLGVFYFDGRFVEVNYDLSVYWLTKSANAGDSNSQALLGRLFAFNFGGLGDVEAGAYWLQKSADSNNSYACTLLGEVYANGMLTGVKDYETAAKLFTKGSELGSMECKQKLAYFYSNALGAYFDRP